MRPFTDVLRDLRGGRIVDEASRQFATVLEAVEAEGKPGTITLTLKVSPPKKGDDALRIVPSIKIKAPEPELPEALMFSDGQGSLLREPRNGGKLFEEAAIESDRRDRREG